MSSQAEHIIEFKMAPHYLHGPRQVWDCSCGKRSRAKNPQNGFRAYLKHVREVNNLGEMAHVVKAN